MDGSVNMNTEYLENLINAVKVAKKPLHITRKDFLSLLDRERCTIELVIEIQHLLSEFGVELLESGHDFICIATGDWYNADLDRIRIGVLGNEVIRALDAEEERKAKQLMLEVKYEYLNATKTTEEVKSASQRHNLAPSERAYRYVEYLKAVIKKAGIDIDNKNNRFGEFFKLFEEADGEYYSYFEEGLDPEDVPDLEDDMAQLWDLKESCEQALEDINDKLPVPLPFEVTSSVKIVAEELLQEIFQSVSDMQERLQHSLSFASEYKKDNL
jgi:hypothetical protein